MNLPLQTSNTFGFFYGRTPELICHVLIVKSAGKPWLKTHSLFHFHTSSTNFSRPMSCLDSPFSLISFFSTTTWVAMPAWSVPGFQSTVRPFIRCLTWWEKYLQICQVASQEETSSITEWHQATHLPYSEFFGTRIYVVSTLTTPYHLMSESCTALVRAWPRWRLPVTLGGGRVIMNRPLGFGSSAVLRWWGKV